MKLTTALMIGVFAVGSGTALADHDHHDRYWKNHHKYHAAEKHHRKAERHERKARKHERIARHHEREAWREYREERREARYRRDYYRDHRDWRDSYGRVLHVEPVYRSVRVQVNDDSCLTRDHYRPRHSSHTGAVLGAVIGTALGHSIGDAHGDPKIAAVAGGLLGASIGNDMDRRASYNRHLRVEGPCRIKPVRYETRRELVEYKVSYRYNGEVHSARMDHDPGEWVKLDVDVSPA